MPDDKLRCAGFALTAEYAEPVIGRAFARPVGYSALRVLELITAPKGHQNCYKGFGSFGGDEATYNSGGGDASGNAAFAPRLPLNLAPPNRS